MQLSVSYCGRIQGWIVSGWHAVKRLNLQFLRLIKGILINQNVKHEDNKTFAVINGAVQRYPFLLLVFFLGIQLITATSVAIAAVPTTGSQQKKATTIINAVGYQSLFKYYNRTSHVFMNDTAGHSVFLDASAMNELSMLVASLKHAGEIPWNESLDARRYSDGIESRVEAKYPMTTLKKLETKMLQNPWQILGVAGSADVLVTAALTGPLVGADLVTGGVAAIGKGLFRGSKIAVKVASIGRNYPKLASAANKIKSIAFRVDVGLGKINKSMIVKLVEKAPNSKKVAAALGFFSSNTKAAKAFNAFKTLLSLTAKGQAAVVTTQVNNDIKAYVGSGDDGSAIYKFFVDYTTGIAAGQLKGSIAGAAAAFYIDLFQTGVVDVAVAQQSDSSLQSTLTGLVQDIGLKASEFVPVLGPIMTTINTNIAANQTIIDTAKKMQANYNTFSNMRSSELNFELNFYRLWVVEDLFKQVFLLKPPAIVHPSLYNDPAYTGTAPGRNRIADAIYETGSKQLSTSIRKAYHECLAKRIMWNRATNTKPVYYQITPIFDALIQQSKQPSPQVAIGTCYISQGTFSVNVDLSTLNRGEEKAAELNFALTEGKLYKIPVSIRYSDISPADSFYRQVKELALRGGVNTQQQRYHPQAKLTQYESLVMITNMFFQNAYGTYRIQQVSTNTDAANRYGFIQQQLGTITGVNLIQKNVHITRSQMAELLMKVIYKQRKAPAPLAGALVGASVNYFNGTCIALTKANEVNTCTGKVNFSLVTTNTTTNKWLAGAIAAGWDVYSTGLKVYGITPGYRSNSFNLTNPITRGEAARLIVNAFHFVEEHK